MMSKEKKEREGEQDPLADLYQVDYTESSTLERKAAYLILRLLDNLERAREYLRPLILKMCMLHSLDTVALRRRALGLTQTQLARACWIEKKGGVLCFVGCSTWLLRRS